MLKKLDGQTPDNGVAAICQQQLGNLPSRKRLLKHRPQTIAVDMAGFLLRTIVAESDQR